MIKKILIVFIAIMGLIGLTDCSTSNTLSQKITGYFAAPTSTKQASLQSFPNNPAFWQNNPDTIWNGLQHITLSQLKSALYQTSDGVTIAWIKLAIISKQYSRNTHELANQLIAWRAQNPDHPGNQLFPDNATLENLDNLPPKHIALLLPLQGSAGASGQKVREGFLNAYYASGQKTGISFYDTTKNTDPSALYQQAVHNGADLIIGPLTKDDVANLLRQGNFTVPTIALNYTNVWFGSLPSNFYEFGLLPEDEAEQVADKAFSAGKRRAIIIASNTSWGQRVAKTLMTRWQSDGGTVVDTLYLTSKMNLAESIPRLMHINIAEDQERMKTENDKTLLEEQRRQDFDVVFLLTSAPAAREVVPLLKFYYLGNTPIYATSSIYSGTPSPAADADLNGVIFCDLPWVIKNSQTNRLTAVGRDAFILSNEIKRLSVLPNFPIFGSTGALTLTSKQQIYRRLPWATMHDGHP